MRENGKRVIGDYFSINETKSNDGINLYYFRRKVLWKREKF